MGFLIFVFLFGLFTVGLFTSEGRGCIGALFVLVLSIVGLLMVGALVLTTLGYIVASI